MGGVSARFALFAAALLFQFSHAPVAAAAAVRNGGFTNGSGGVPADWRSEAWSRETVRFTWDAEDGGDHSVGIVAAQPNDARWCQTITVVPGATYRVTTRVRTRDVGLSTSGAHIAIEPRIGDSADLRGTQDWQTLDLTARAADDDAEWDVCLRLGSYANLNTGSAWFADVAVLQVGAPVARPTSERFAAWFAQARTSWTGIIVPAIGGTLLAWGLGVWPGRRFRARAH
jgi:hypothetical protein